MEGDTRRVEPSGARSRFVDARGPEPIRRSRAGPWIADRSLWSLPVPHWRRHCPLTAPCSSSFRLGVIVWKWSGSARSATGSTAPA